MKSTLIRISSITPKAVYWQAASDFELREDAVTSEYTHYLGRIGTGSGFHADIADASRL